MPDGGGARTRADVKQMFESPTAVKQMLKSTVEQLEAQLRHAEMLQAERHAAVLAVWSASGKVDEYDWAVEEANRSLDLESSLLGGELERDREEEDMMEEVVKRLKDKEEELVRRLEEWREKSQVELEVARTRLEHSETALETLEEEQNTTGDSLDTDEELKLLEKLKHCHEQLEAERRVFEDLEFRLMEDCLLYTSDAADE